MRIASTRVRFVLRRVVLSLTGGAYTGNSLTSLDAGGRRGTGGHSRSGKKGGEDCKLHLGVWVLEQDSMFDRMDI